MFFNTLIHKVEAIITLINFSQSVVTGIVDSGSEAESRINNICEVQLIGALVILTSPSVLEQRGVHVATWSHTASLLPGDW